MVNFTSNQTCKRCKLEFSESLVSEAEAIKTDAVAYEFWPPRNVPSEKPEPDWEAFSSRLREGLEEPVQEAAPHTVGTVFFAICLIITQIALLFQVNQYVHLGENGEWAALTNMKSPLYVPVYEKMYWLEVSFKSIIFVTQIFLLWAFFARSKKFLRLVSPYLIGLLFFVLLDGWAFSVFESSIREKRLGPSVDAAMANIHGFMPLYFISLVLVAAWFLYFTVSKRIRNIFIY